MCKTYSDLNLHTITFSNNFNLTLFSNNVSCIYNNISLTEIIIAWVLYSYATAQKRYSAMMLQQRFILIFSLFSALLMVRDCDTNNAPEALLSNDQEALSYCQAKTNTYVGIVWPLGIEQLDYVINTLNQHAYVKYIKRIAFTKRDLFALYRHVHKRLSYKSAKKYFTPYIRSHLKKPYIIAALVIETNEPLEVIQGWKKEIRDTIGCGYQAFHINDHYPETIEAAEALFSKNGEGL